MNNVLKRLLIAFAVGGVSGLLGQIFMSIELLFLDPSSNFIAPITLFGIGFVGCILCSLGIYQKLEKVAGFSACMPFSGLSAACGGIFFGMKMEGAPTGACIKACLKLVLRVLGIGSLVAIALSFICYQIHPDPAWFAAGTGSAAGAQVGPIKYLTAFVLGGLVCVFFEIVFMAGKGKITIPVLLLSGIILGALMAGLHLTQPLIDWGGAGLVTMILDAGEAVFSTFSAIWYFHAYTAPVAVLVVYCLVPTFGVIGGAIHLWDVKRKIAAGKMEPPQPQEH